MNECAGKKFMLNGDLQPCEVFDKSLVYEGDSVYEVLRLANGIPVFFADHMERLMTSVRLQKKQILCDIPELKNAIISLNRLEKKHDANLKIVFNYNGSTSNYLIYFIESVYPTQSQYQNGVKGILYFAERRDPQSKVIDHKLRTSICSKLLQEGAYEAILVNENNLVTEGSRSNIFFLKKDKLITAPDSVILNGITRKRVLEICAGNNINVEFDCVKTTEIKDYDAAFMTGTSPMVLPFAQIGDNLFNVNYPVIEKLRMLYQQEARESTKQFISL